MWIRNPRTQEKRRFPRKNVFFSVQKKIKTRNLFYHERRTCSIYHGVAKIQLSGSSYMVAWIFRTSRSCDRRKSREFQNKNAIFRWEKTCCFACERHKTTKLLLPQREEHALFTIKMLKYSYLDPPTWSHEDSEHQKVATAENPENFRKKYDFPGK